MSTRESLSDRLTRLIRQERHSRREAEMYARIGADKAFRYWSRRAASQQRRIDALLEPICR